MSTVRILQHVQPETPGTIRDALNQQDVSSETVRIDQGDPVPDTLDADGLVVMGGPMGVDDIPERPHLSKEINLIEQALQHECPILGVCLGSQLLAHVLGADVQPAASKEIGWKEVTLTEAAETDPLFRNVDAPFPAFHWHGDEFSLPDGAVHLARSSQTQHQAFRYGSNAYGLLFHLEVTPNIVAQMTRTFKDELVKEEREVSTIRQAAHRHEETIRDTASTVFGQWANRLRDST